MQLICPHCEGKGYWFSNDKMIICSCEQEKQLRMRIGDIGISPRLYRNRLEKFNLSLYGGKNRVQAEMALNAAREFVEGVMDGSRTDGIIFQGSVGSGKTYLASAIINALFKTRPDVRFVVLPELLDKIKDTYDKKSILDTTEWSIVDSVKTAGVLVIDDFGAYNWTDWSTKIMFSIINYRLNYELPTIITTNLNNAQIEEQLGSRLLSRLVEMCEFYALNSDKDIRLQKRLKVV